MVGKELRKLSRRELIDIIYRMKTNEQQMQEEITSLRKALQDKRLRLSEAGSVAQAAVSVTELLENAQKTADLYLREIACRKEDTEKECAAKIEAADRAVGKILAEGKKKHDILRTRYRSDYAKWKQLRAEIAALEEMKKRRQYGGTGHGEEDTE